MTYVLIFFLALQVYLFVENYDLNKKIYEQNERISALNERMSQLRDQILQRLENDINKLCG